VTNLQSGARRSGGLTARLATMFLLTADCMAEKGTVVPRSSETRVASGAAAALGAGAEALAAAGGASGDEGATAGAARNTHVPR
jgi:hypothetical protein